MKADHYRLVGFRLEARFRFRINRRRCRVNPEGIATVERLLELFLASKNAKKVTWLLAFRGHIKEIEELNCRSVLSLIVERTPNKRMRLLAIWLRGRCGGFIGGKTVGAHRSSSDFKMRKEVARSLQRLSAWAMLSEMAANDTNERVRRMAAPRLPRTRKVRLEHYSRNVRLIHIASQTKRPMWVSPKIECTNGKPAKSPAIIRQILERIHCLVTGHSKHSAT